MDFTLPADTGLTKHILKKATKPIRLDLYVGCAKWGRKEWVGMICPPKTREADFLAEYVKQFNSIECYFLWYAEIGAGKCLAGKGRGIPFRF